MNVQEAHPGQAPIEEPVKLKDQPISKDWVNLASEKGSWKRAVCAGLTVALVVSLGFVLWNSDWFAKFRPGYQDPELVKTKEDLQNKDQLYLQVRETLAQQESKCREYAEMAKERTEMAQTLMEQMLKLQQEHKDLANVALNQIAVNKAQAQMLEQGGVTCGTDLALNHRRFEEAVAKADEICKKQYNDRCKERYSLSHVRNLVKTPLNTVDQWKANRQAAFERLGKLHWLTAEEILEEKQKIKEEYARNYPVDHLDFWQWNFRVFAVPTDGYRCDICKNEMDHGDAAYGNRIISMDACADCCAKYKEGTARRLVYTHPLIQEFMMQRFATFPASSCEAGSHYVCDLCDQNIYGEVFGEKREFINDAILGSLHNINNKWNSKIDGNISTLDCCQACRQKYQGLHSNEGVIAELMHEGSQQEMAALNRFEIDILLKHFAGFNVTDENFNQELGGKIIAFRKAFFVGRDMHDENDPEDPANHPDLKGLGDIWVHVGDNEVHVQAHSHDASKQVAKRIFGRREYFVYRGIEPQENKVLALAPNQTKGWVSLIGVDGSPILRKRSEILMEVQHQWAQFYKWYRQIRREIHSDNCPTQTPLLGLQYAIAKESEDFSSSSSSDDYSDSAEISRTEILDRCHAESFDTHSYDEYDSVTDYESMETSDSFGAGSAEKA